LRLNDHLHGRGDLLALEALQCPDGLVGTTLPRTTQQQPCDRKPCVRRLSTTVPRQLTSSILHSVIGTTPKRLFVIHESIITPHSAFVRRALRGDWKESEEGVFLMPEDDSVAFLIYQSWLYYARIYSQTRVGSDEYQLLAHCYILGEKLVDPQFQAALTDCIVDKLRTTRLFDPRLSNLIYGATPEKAPIRVLLQDV